MKQPVLIFKANRSSPLQQLWKRKQKNLVQLLLVPAEDFKRYDTNPGKFLPYPFYKNAHCLDDVRNSKKKANFCAMTMEEFDHQLFSLVLTKDHGLDSSIKLCIIDIKTSSMIFSVDFFSNFSYVDFKQDISKNESEKTMAETNLSNGLRVLCCLEYSDRYEVDFSVRGFKVTTEKGESLIKNLISLQILINILSQKSLLRPTANTRPFQPTGSLYLSQSLSRSRCNFLGRSELMEF